MSQLVVFLALAFSIVIAIFAVQNTTPVAVQFLGFRVEGVAVSVMVLISAALGAAAILLLGIAREVQWRWRQRSLNQQLRQARSEAVSSQPSAISAPSEGTAQLPSTPVESPPREVTTKAEG